MGYYFVRYMPKKGEPLQIGGVEHPALIARCSSIPIGVDRTRFEAIITDPFERALVLTTGIIIKYVEDVHWDGATNKTVTTGYVSKAWRAKRGKWYRTAVQRGHRLKVRE